MICTTSDDIRGKCIAVERSTMREDTYDVIAGNVRARGGAILVTQFASATAVAVAAASLAGCELFARGGASARG